MTDIVYTLGGTMSGVQVVAPEGAFAMPSPQYGGGYAYGSAIPAAPDAGQYGVVTGADASYTNQYSGGWFVNPASDGQSLVGTEPSDNASDYLPTTTAQAPALVGSVGPGGGGVKTTAVKATPTKVAVKTPVQTTVTAAPVKTTTTVAPAKTTTATGGGAAATKTDKPAAAEKPKDPAPPKNPEYTVKSGDSLWKIAHDHGISDWHTLYDLNKDHLPAPYEKNGTTFVLIHPGEKLKLPADKPADKPKTDDASPEKKQLRKQLKQVDSQIIAGNKLIVQYQQQLPLAQSQDVAAELQTSLQQTQQDQQTLMQVRSTILDKLGEEDPDADQITVPGTGQDQATAGVANVPAAGGAVQPQPQQVFTTQDQQLLTQFDQYGLQNVYTGG